MSWVVQVTQLITSIYVSGREGVKIYVKSIIHCTMYMYLSSGHFLSHKNNDYKVKVFLKIIIQADDDLESGYRSPGSDSSRSQTHRAQNANNFIMPEQKVSMLDISIQILLSG